MIYQLKEFKEISFYIGLYHLSSAEEEYLYWANIKRQEKPIKIMSKLVENGLFEKNQKG